MGTSTLDRARTISAANRERRVTAVLFLVGGLLMAAGGQQHPVGTGSTVEAHLLSMFDSPRWNLAHLLLLIGGVVNLLAFVSAWRTSAFGPRVQRWLPAAIIGWGFGAVELLPHLLAALAVVGGVLSAAAGPLVVFTGDPRWTVLFPFQAGLASWLVGTGIRLLRRC